MVSVATILPVPYREPAPYTLGEAVAELGAYAHASNDTSWVSNAGKSNRASLCREVLAQANSLGERLRARLEQLLNDLRDDSNRVGMGLAAAKFIDVWHTKDSRADAFRDLCDAAQHPHATSWDLRLLSAIIASQLGAASVGYFSPLQRAADALLDTDEIVARQWGHPASIPVTEENRLCKAEEVLTADTVGNVVVWTAYSRARAGIRTSAGPLTFLQTNWALPNTFKPDGQDFPERAELLDIRRHARWLDELYEISGDAGSRFVLARADLGERQIAGAAEEARRRISALLGIAVEAGGVSWLESGHTALLLDGKVWGTSSGTLRGLDSNIGDNYGIGATARILSNLADDFADALSARPMPDGLVEALASLQEARMTDHRDVTSYGDRRTTPRVATALEDHAMELIASLLEITPKELADCAQYHQARVIADSRVLGQLLAPFDDEMPTEDHVRRREIESEFARFEGGLQVVNVARAIERQQAIRTLPMSALQHADFENGVAVCTTPVREREILDQAWRYTTLIRDRHRRVRNAVNHGLPLTTTTINSVRGYAEATSRYALDLALTWFKDKKSGADLIHLERDVWKGRLARINREESWAEGCLRESW